MRNSTPTAVRPRPQGRAITASQSDGWDRSEGPALERLQFLGAFLRNPAGVGALLPSSRALARRLVEACDVARARAVVELGPGTGAVTGVLLEELGRRARFFALELDRNSTLLLRRRFPGCDIHHDSAENLRQHVDRYGLEGVDGVVSGLPWGNMKAALQDRILQSVVQALVEGGKFTTFAYIPSLWLPNARRFRRMLTQRFASVETSRVVWANLPPAVVYRCVKGGSAAPISA